MTPKQLQKQIKLLELRDKPLEILSNEYEETSEMLYNVATDKTTKLLNTVKSTLNDIKDKLNETSDFILAKKVNGTYKLHG